MKEAIQLQLTKPCHENWNVMTATEQGRYCQSCCKTVVDFSILSDREILEYVSGHAGGETCARVGDDQLNRIIATPRERKTGWKYFWTMAISSLLLTYRSLAQVQPPKNMTVNMGVNPGQPGGPVTIHLGGISSTPAAPVDFKLHGRIADENGEPVPFATITVKSSGKQVVADFSGRFVFQANDLVKHELSVSAVGYEDLSIGELQAKQIKSIEIINKQVNVWMADMTLKRQVKQLKEVQVIAYGKATRQYLTGAMSYVRKSTLTGKVKDTICSLAGSDIKIYPNPAPVNSSFYVKFNVKEAGEYNIQFMDASGRVVGGKQLTIVQPGQVETFPAGALQSHGMYFIRVAGKKDGKVYSTKLEVL